MNRLTCCSSTSTSCPLHLPGSSVHLVTVLTGGRPISWWRGVSFTLVVSRGKCERWRGLENKRTTRKSRHFIKSHLHFMLRVFSPEKLTAWCFLLWDGPDQIRGNWFNGFSLMARCSLLFPLSSAFLSLFFFSFSCLHLVSCISSACTRFGVCVCVKHVWMLQRAAERENNRKVFWLNKERELGSIAVVKTTPSGSHIW